MERLHLERINTNRGKSFRSILLFCKKLCRKDEKQHEMFLTLKAAILGNLMRTLTSRGLHDTFFPTKLYRWLRLK